MLAFVLVLVLAFVLVLVLMVVELVMLMEVVVDDSSVAPELASRVSPWWMSVSFPYLVVFY